MKRKGLTFIEMILYIALSGSFFVVLVTLLLNISDSRNKTYVIQEVHANSRYVFENVGRIIRSSEGVNVGASTFDTDPGVLSLQMTEAALNPTIIELNQDNGRLQITQGANPTVFLTTDEVRIMNFQFHNFDDPLDPKIISFDTEVSFGEGDQQGPIFNYTHSFQSSARIRK